MKPTRRGSLILLAALMCAPFLPSPAAAESPQSLELAQEGRPATPVQRHVPRNPFTPPVTHATPRPITNDGDHRYTNVDKTPKPPQKPPVVTDASPPPLPALVGIVRSGAVEFALLKVGAAVRTVRVGELVSGYRVQSVRGEGRTVVLTHDHHTVTLRLEGVAIRDQRN